MPSQQIELVQDRGVPPVLFGMTQEHARDAMETWGTLRDAAGMPGAGRLHVRDDNFTRDIYVNVEDGETVTSVEIWRPQAASDRVSILFEGIDVFGSPADDVIAQLGQRGYVVDTSDPYFPTCSAVALGFNRSGGDDVDDMGVSRFFRSVLIAPPGYYA